MSALCSNVGSGPAFLGSILQTLECRSVLIAERSFSFISGDGGAGAAILLASAQLIHNVFGSRGQLDLMRRATGTNGFTTDHTYDAIGRVVSLFNDTTGTANDLTISQGYSAASQIITQTRSNDLYSWTGAVAVNRHYTANGLNQYMTAGPAAFCYDGNGNLTADGASVYRYDIENRLVEKRAQLSTVCPTNTSGYEGTLQASLRYDPMGRLYETSGAAGATRFVHDGDELVAEYDATGAMLRRYVHSDRVDDPVVQYDGSPVGAAARTFLLPDERGSIAGMIRNDGSLQQANTYDEYGIPGASNQGRFQYTGQAWIPELGMYYYKTRFYSPTLGRFLQNDLVGYDGGLNLYAYADSDPIGFTDPEGTKPESFWDRTYIYPNLSETQRNGIDHEHYKIGEAAAPSWGMAAGIAAVALAPEVAVSALYALEYRVATVVAGREAARRGLGPRVASNSGTGVKWAKRGGDTIRVEKARPSAPYPSQRVPNVREVHQGRMRDAAGNEVKRTPDLKPSENPSSHIRAWEWIKRVIQGGGRE